MPRACIIVLDAVGAGELPDAADFGDAGSSTLAHVADAVGGLDLPNLQKLGLGNMMPLRGCPPLPAPPSVVGRLRERSLGKDTTTGHWELAGVITPVAMPTYPNGFPADVIDAFVAATGRGVLGNKPASGTEMIQELGDEQVETGKWIVYTSADSVFQVAAHERVIPLDELYEACRKARAILTPPHNVGRVIARPFDGTSGSYARTPNRHDFSLEPARPNHLTRIREAGGTVHAVGKIADIFAGCDIDTSSPTRSNAEGTLETIRLLRELDEGLIFTNLVETDSDVRPPERPRGVPPLPAGVRPRAAGDPRCAPRRRPADPLLRPRLRPDHGVHRPLPRARAARGPCPVAAAGRRDPPRRRLLRRRRDRPRVADRHRSGRRRAGRADPVPVRAVDLIAKKRDGGTHDEAELRFLVDGFLDGSVAPEQMSAWCMAVVWRGLDDAEIDALCAAMVESGDVVDLAPLGRTVVDKHSTGGVGDKVTLALAPLVAACGVPVAKMSGRGLGHTGRHARQARGDSRLPDRDPDPRVRGAGARRRLRRGGADEASSCRPTPKIYALRDVTATVPRARADRDLRDVEEARVGRRTRWCST